MKLFAPRRVSTIFIVLLCAVCPVCTPVPVSGATRYEAGISTTTSLLWMNNRNLNSRLNDIEHLGAKWVRVDFRWPLIQPDSKNEYHWGLYDRLVHAAGVHQLKVLAVLDYTPKWAQEPWCAKLVRSANAAQRCNPKHNALFADFAGVAAGRYRGKAVRGWEIWNEPNLSSYWKVAQAHNTVLTETTEYAVLANAGAAAIRAHDPGTIIITGGLGPLFNPVYPKGLQQGDFLTKLLPQLHKSLFDGIGVHPYSWPALPGKPAMYNAFYTVDHGPLRYDLKKIMAHAGWGDKQIWGTEFGAPTLGVTRLSAPSRTFRPDHVTELAQARIIEQGISDWYKIRNVGPLFIHSDDDHYLTQSKNEGSFGLRRYNNTKKPSYGAYQRAVRHI